jgi:hypothetical protein
MPHGRRKGSHKGVTRANGKIEVVDRKGKAVISQG